MSDAEIRATDPDSTAVYPVLPLRDIVVFPHMIVPLFVGREKSIKALEEVMTTDKHILLATQMNAADDDPNPDQIYNVGTLATVLQLLKLPDNTVKVLVEGGARAQIEVTYATGGAERVARVDTLVALVGYRPDLQLARELHAHLCYASEGPMKLAASLLKASASAGGTSGGDCMSQAAPGAGTLLTPEPRFFVLGAKSYARNPAFLLRVGFEQARLVAELLRADADARSHEGPAAVVAGAQ